MKKALVLLIGEVIEDPRVYKTCRSLSKKGVSVTVGCTNMYNLPAEEKHEGISIFRFPHRTDSVLKKVYLWTRKRFGRTIGSVATGLHENVPDSGIASFIRDTAIRHNFRHFMSETDRIGLAMVNFFSGNKFDFIHCNDLDTLGAGVNLKNNGVTGTLVYDAHEYWPGIGIMGSSPNDILGELEKGLIKFADHVVTVNPMIGDKLKDIYGLDKTVSIVMNCPCYDNREPDISFDNSPLRVIYQGRLMPFRGLEELVSAFKYIDDAVLTLSGDGPTEESLKELVRKENLSEKVIFKGRFGRNDAMDVLIGNDIGIFTIKDITLNLRYTSPNKLFDYAMAGLAVAASDLPFVREVVTKYEVGELFEKIEAEFIAEKINSLCNNRELLKKYKLKSRECAVKYFNWDIQFNNNYPVSL